MVAMGLFQKFNQAVSYFREAPPTSRYLWNNDHLW